MLEIASLNRRDLPGWYGKLPGMGDFAQRRLPEYFRDAWDSWLQAGLFALRQREADWVERYLGGPIWFFALGPQLIGALPWLGVMMPSVDSAGRYFPLTLALELSDAAGRPRACNLAWADAWWRASAQAALQALESDFDASRFEAALTLLFASQDASPAGPAEPRLALPVAGQSSWSRDPGAAAPGSITVPGLPVQTSFDVLFGYGAASCASVEVGK